MAVRRVIPAALLSSLAAGAVAQAPVTSPAPDRVAVTIYRDPGRQPDREPSPDWLNGYALISETRRISVPAGESTIRFEGVAGGILPQSAIVTGFPEQIVERNHDAWLLSPASLLARSLGRRVHLRRTSAATGATREQEAEILSGAGGALLLRTAAGVEALRCGGFAETLVYDEVPAGLSARPTLSVRARANRPATATVTLSYLASGFDWQANYIGHLADDGASVDLFAWLTLISSDETSFAQADAQAVAGRVNREPVEGHEPSPDEGSLRLLCWPDGRTGGTAEQEALVVTASEVALQGTIRTEDLVNSLPQAFAGGRMAVQENLGDLKLYRIPEPVTVAANGQKQVALLRQSGVRVRLVYRQLLSPLDGHGAVAPSRRVLVTRNRGEDGLGLPLPGGSLVLFGGARDRPILIGEGSLPDRAIGENVEIDAGEAPGVSSLIEQTAVRQARRGERREFLLTISNDQSVPVLFEAEFDVEDLHGFTPRQPLARRDGRPLWAVTIPANGRATLRYRTVEPIDES